MNIAIILLFAWKLHVYEIKNEFREEPQPPPWLLEEPQPPPWLLEEFELEPEPWNEPNVELNVA